MLIVGCAVIAHWQELQLNLSNHDREDTMIRRYFCLFALTGLLFAGCETSTVEKQDDAKESNENVETVASSSPAATGDFLLIDVRSQKEWDEGHLETAIHIPHTDIVEGIKSVTKDKSAKICLF